MRKCDSCGKLYQESKDVFCPHCGAVAHKQCTHTSSFDSKRYDRGELYKYNNTQYKNTTYNQGYEPHAQREKTQYNQPESTFGNGGNYSEDLPKINLPDIKTVFSKGKNQSGKFIGIIVICIIFAFNFIVGILDDVDIDYSSDYEEVSEYDVIMGDVYPVVKNASITLVEEDNYYKTFELNIENMYFSIDEIDYREYIREQIIENDILVEMNVCTFSETSIPEEEFDSITDEGYLVAANNDSTAGSYKFTCDFDYDEIVYLNSGVNIYLENGSCVIPELPFVAFSISEDGSVTYYTSYASDETDWKTVFMECSNEGSAKGFSGYIDFDEE